MIEKEQLFEFDYNDITYYYNRYNEPYKIKVEKTKDNKLKFIGIYRCYQCGGNGIAHLSDYNGICYTCRGSGFTQVNLKVTKNKATAKRRIKKDLERRQIEFETNYGKLVIDNLEKINKIYGNVFYLIYDTEEYSTYKSKEYLKSKGAKWNPKWQCWWIKDNKQVKNDFKDFYLVLINTQDVLTEFNKIDDSIIYSKTKEYKQDLLFKGGGVI